LLFTAIKPLLVRISGAVGNCWQLIPDKRRG
jgi:hypothetical protein